MPKYAIGVDFGTLSGRGVLVDVSDGREIASAQLEYPHGVMDRALPNGTKLGSDWALQHPMDYLDVLAEVLPKLAAAVNPKEIIAIGLDCTSSTVLPVDENGTPLCFQDEFAPNPYAYVMMWKHHAGQEQARRMTEIALERKEPWLKNYGGIVNAEWLFPKLLQLFEEAPDVYGRMAHYVEAVDWLVWQLTGRHTRSAGCLGYKALYTGVFPEEAYFEALNPGFRKVVTQKLRGPVAALGSRAGVLGEAVARRYGLCPGTPVAAGNIDAHVCLPAAGIDGPGKLLAIIGTSTCHIVMDHKATPVPGMSGVVQDGVMPGYAGYEAGQSCVGDHFGWLEKQMTPPAYVDAAKRRGVTVQEYLTELAAELRPGQSGLLALDWWNGNRSVLADSDLTGLLLGMTLQTKAEEIYRALIEATAFGARVILDNYRASGVAVNEFYVSGGVSRKNPLAMQIYADVLNMPVHIAGATQGPALGSAIFAAVAAGEEAGGYATVAQAARAMGSAKAACYLPKSTEIYEKLYREYLSLHDYFGRGANDVMKRLKAIRLAQ
ncbi:MAG: ribulokinase [Eubacteriales bacterium]|nr:ribulokinase [Eubacteriales bacterium]